jgi:hypothetical protein
MHFCQMATGRQQTELNFVKKLSKGFFDGKIQLEQKCKFCSPSTKKVFMKLSLG